MAGKRDPTLSCPPGPPSRLKSMPLQIGFYITQAVRYEQLIFLFLFAFLRSFLLSPSRFYFCVSFFPFMSVLSFISPFLWGFSSWYSEHVSSFHSVCLCDLCCRHLPVGLNSPVCVMEHIAVIRMITVWPAPLPCGAEFQSIIKFLHCLPSTGQYQCQLVVGVCIYEFLISVFVSSCWILVYKSCIDQEVWGAIFAGVPATYKISMLSPVGNAFTFRGCSCGPFVEFSFLTFTTPSSLQQTCI